MHTPFAACTLLCATVAAQSYVYVPPPHQSVDAPSLGRFAGFTQRTRQQILVDRSYLSTANNRSLTGLTLRRDGSYLGALAGGAVDLTLALSSTDVAPAQAQMRFAQNRTRTSTTVVQSRINLPASPALTTPNDATWSSPHAVALPFSQSFAYAGAHLCLDVEGTPVTSNSTSWWPIDYAIDASAGSIVSVGNGCGRFGRASTARNQLVVGGNMRLLASGEPDSVAVSLLGLDTSLNLAMDFLGATGCTLRVNPLLSLTSLYANSGDPRKPGIAELNFFLPNEPGFVGARLGVQWVDFQRLLPPPRWSNPGGLTFSNALELTLSARTQSVFGTTIEAGVHPTGALPDSGEVTPCRLPVMRFEFP